MFALVVIACAVSPLGGVNAPGQVLPNLVRANERFGRRLFEKVHKGEPEQNVVVCPVSLTIILAAIESTSWGSQLSKEIGDTLGWGFPVRLGIPVRMLLGAFDEPKRQPAPSGGGSMADALPDPIPVREESWITNTFMFRSEDLGQKLEPLAQMFVDDSSKYFGMKFVDAGTANPTVNELRAARPSAGALPQVPAGNDVWISSDAHLRTHWGAYAFYFGRPFTGEFRAARGDKRQVEMITSGMSKYPHAVTDSFEAVVLPCDRAYMVAVLPAPGKDIHELERDLADYPETLDGLLNEELGEVIIPTFRIGFETDLRTQLEEMGIKGISKDLGLMIRPGSHLTEVEQKVDFVVDKQGISASAEPVAGVVYGITRGPSKGPPPKMFKMQIDRPFVFLVRDNNTNALLFMGAVMDPTQSH